MPKRQRRQSQNSRYMREILDKLRDYDVEEVRLLCERYQQRHNPRHAERNRRSASATRKRA